MSEEGFVIWKQEPENTIVNVTKEGEIQFLQDYYEWRINAEDADVTISICLLIDMLHRIKTYYESRTS